MRQFGLRSKLGPVACNYGFRFVKGWANAFTVPEVYTVKSICQNELLAMVFSWRLRRKLFMDKVLTITSTELKNKKQ